MLDESETPKMTTVERLRAIGSKADFAKCQDQLGREAVDAAEDLPLIDREKKLGQADMHFTAYSDTVEQLIDLICGNALADLQMDTIERHLASVGV